MEPYAYYHNGRFYKSLEELKGHTISDDNLPLALYTGEDLHKAHDAGFEEGAKAASDDIMGSYNLRR